MQQQVMPRGLRDAAAVTIAMTQLDHEEDSRKTPTRWGGYWSFDWNQLWKAWGGEAAENLASTSREASQVDGELFGPGSVWQNRRRAG